ncbi:lysylphosphatidylglycerol synthase domain-containing protein, partial [Turicibacter sanguinis]
FGLSDFSYLKVLSLQAILYIAVSAIPLPGAVGVSEGGFVMLFATLFPKMLIDSAMLLSRGISFYLFVAISGLVVLLGHLLIAKQNKKKEGLTS